MRLRKSASRYLVHFHLVPDGMSGRKRAGVIVLREFRWHEEGAATPYQVPHMECEILACLCQDYIEKSFEQSNSIIVSLSHDVT